MVSPHEIGMLVYTLHTDNFKDQCPRCLNRRTLVIGAARCGVVVVSVSVMTISDHWAQAYQGDQAGPGRAPPSL